MKSPRLNSPERRETQRQVITLIGWLIRLIVEAIKSRKAKGNKPSAVSCQTSEKKLKTEC